MELMGTPATLITITYQDINIAMVAIHIYIVTMCQLNMHSSKEKGGYCRLKPAYRRVCVAIVRMCSPAAHQTKKKQGSLCHEEFHRISYTASCSIFIHLNV